MKIKTALTIRETSTLQQLAYGKRVYEAGALLGYSTVALASVARQVISVDPHNGYPRQKPRPTWDKFLENLRATGVYGKVMPVRNTFEVIPVAGADLVWADLTGQAPITETFLKHAANCRLIAIHDYLRSGCEGATRAIDDFITLTKPRHVSVTDTLIIIER